MTKQPDMKADPQPLETRYFIGVSPEGWRISLTAGPARFDNPPAPFALGEQIEVFPVSRAVALEWDGGPDEDDYEIDLSPGDKCDTGRDDTDEPGKDAMRWGPGDQEGIGQ